MSESNRGDESEYVVKSAHQLRVGDAVTHCASSVHEAMRGNWKPYSIEVTEHDCTRPLGAAAAYVYRVRAKPDEETRPYAMREPHAKEARIVQVNADLLPAQRAFLAMDYTTCPPHEGRREFLTCVENGVYADTVQPDKIDGVWVAKLQVMYALAQRDLGDPIARAFTPAQRAYLRTWWSEQVKRSTAQPEAARASDMRRRPPRGVTVVVDRQDEP